MPKRVNKKTGKPISDEFIKELKAVFQDSNLNCLIGSGLSRPYFDTLGSIEIWLNDLKEKKNASQIDIDHYKYLKFCLHVAYYNAALGGNVEILECKDLSEEDADQPLGATYSAYRDFLQIIQNIIYRRDGNVSTKQVNLFTTNIDIFLERTCETQELNFNDGFSGSFKRTFRISNFGRSEYKKNLQYGTSSEIPVFNVIKIHGSASWKMTNETIEFDWLKTLKELSNVKSKCSFYDIQKENNKFWAKEERDFSIDELIIRTRAKGDEKYPDTSDFEKIYSDLAIVNPTTDKLRLTTLGKEYYEMLRLFSNELDKENTILLVLGFSMADQHIREIIIRSLKSNPTLKVYIVSYTAEALDIRGFLKKDTVEVDSYHNLEFISPSDNFDLDQFNKKVLRPLEELVFGKNDSGHE